METDTGWAWVVMMASMGCNFLNGVLCYFVGVVHTGLLHKYQASVTTTAWVGALYSANMSLTAPLAAVVIDRYGCRVCCFVGGLLCFAGFLASAFVPTIHWLFVTYGVMAGVGLGLTYSPSIISIGFYFDKFRGMASGISVGFAAIGILSGSLIAQSLIDQYGVSGAFILIAAISLHLCFFGFFFRPTEYERNRAEISVDETRNGVLDNRGSRLSLALHGIQIRTVSQTSIHRDREVGRPGHGSVTSLLRRAQVNRRRQSMENSSLAASVLSGGVGGEVSTPIFRSEEGSCSILVPSADIVQVELEEVKSPSSEGVDKARLTPARAESPPKSSGIGHVLPHDGQTSGSPLPASPQNFRGPGIVVERFSEDAASEWLPLRHRSASEATESHLDPQNLRDVSLDEDGGSHRLYPNSPLPSFMDDKHSVTSRDGAAHSPRRYQGSPTLKTKTLKAVDGYLAVLTHKAFMFHCTGVLVANIHISGVYLHLPEYVLTKGTSPTQAAALFIAVGIFSLLSRLASGFSTMDPKIDPLTLNMGMMGLCGLATAFFPLFSDTYVGQLVFSAIFGLYTGGLYALVSVLSVHFMGIFLLPTALGVLAFLMGVGYIAGPPLAAMIVDSGGTYQHSFMFLGSMMMLGSVMDMLAVFVSKSEEEEEKKGEEADGEVEVASISRDWLGSTILISFPDTGSAHVQQYDPGSVVSVRSHLTRDT